MNREEFYEWYDSLSNAEQAKVDDLADDMGLPLYDDCSDAELSTLMECCTDVEGSCVNGSSNIDADLYVFRILFEIDPGHDVPYPEVAEDIISVFATSPQEAKEYALRQWGNKPYERIEIIDINPEDLDEELPFGYDGIEASDYLTKETGHRNIYSSTDELDASESKVIFEDEFFSLIRSSGVGINNTPWEGLDVVSKGLAAKHVVDIRLKRVGWPEFNGEFVKMEYDPYGTYVANGMRSEQNTLDETQELIEVLEDAVEFAKAVDEWLAHNYQ